MSYADVNGVSLYHEEHGSGQPLILLHGGLGSGDMYAAIMPQLAKGRASADLPAAVIPFLDEPSLEPPAPFGR